SSILYHLDTAFPLRSSCIQGFITHDGGRNDVSTVWTTNQRRGFRNPSSGHRFQLFLTDALKSGFSPKSFQTSGEPPMGQFVSGPSLGTGPGSSPRKEPLSDSPNIDNLIAIQKD
ncbi:hypothetical protein Ancab_010604, partial [Ancistrocladus abbreviatus]